MEYCHDFSMYHADSLQEIFEHNYDFDKLASHNDWLRHDVECQSNSFSTDSTSESQDCPVQQIPLSTSSISSFSHNHTSLSSCTTKDSRNRSSNTLPTPPHSPPTEYDLDNIIAAIPEILECPPSTLFPAIEDVLHDLENSQCQQYKNIKPYSSSHSFEISPRAQTDVICMNSNSTPLIGSLHKDSMWGGGTTSLNNDPGWKARTVSESSDDPRVYSDEEDWSYMPETPCVSDEDLDYTKGEAVASPVKARTVVASSVILSPKSAVKREHNYCGRRLSEGSKSSDSEDEVDVVSWFDSSDSPSKSPTTENVKKHLQMVIHESIRSKQKRSKPTKAALALSASRATADVLSPEETPTMVPSPEEVCGAKLKLLTRGKPEAYTKRMREQHEVLIKNKRRKTNASDPEDDVEKRSNHNIMERNRRVNIRNLFYNLRVRIPDTQNSEKASKVVVLNKAREYIGRMHISEAKLVDEKDALMKVNEFLQNKLRDLC